MRLIDADALNKKLCATTIFIKDGEAFQRMINDAPTVSAEAVQEWIPCSERLPDERQDVYVTVLWDDYGDYITAYGMRTRFGWHLHSNAEGELIKGYTVIAWMPLPERYTKGDNDEER